jgi:Holliday junction resolvase RusA-like endonuclease
MKYIIEGDPVALARPRMSGRAVYDSQKQLKLVAGLALRSQHGDKPFYEGPLHMDVQFYLKISQRRKDSLENQPHRSKPDLSNLLKFLEDIGTGILYHDDMMISEVVCGKYYSDIPRTEFTIRELK